MYKKITHAIVEEHFNHPAVLPKQLGNFGMLAKPHDSRALKSMSDALPIYVMNDSTMKFMMDARSAWTKWVWSLLNYSISLNGNLPGTEQVKGRMHKNAVALGDFLVPYYGLTASRAVVSALLALDDIGLQYVEAIKGKKSEEEITKIVDSWKPYVAELAKLFNELNPNNWPELLILDIFTNIVKAWQDQLTARARGDLIADEVAIDYIDKLVVTGIPDHSSNGFSSLADIFSRGIVAQFPSLFSD